MQFDNLKLTFPQEIPGASLRANRAEVGAVQITPDAYTAGVYPMQGGDYTLPIELLVPDTSVQYYPTVAANVGFSTTVFVRSTKRLVVLLSFESNLAGTTLWNASSFALHANGVERARPAVPPKKLQPGLLTMHVSWSFAPVPSEVGTLLTLTLAGRSDFTMNHAVLEVR